MKIKKMGFMLMVLAILLSGGVFVRAESVFAAKCATSDNCIIACGPGLPCCSVDTNIGGNICGLEDAGGLLGWTCSDTDLAGFVSGHLCTVCESAGSHSVCLIDSLSNRSCGGCNQDGYRFCSEDRCVAYYNGSPIPGGDPSLDGQKNCYVSNDCTDSGDCIWVSGKWDYSDGKCVQCNDVNGVIETVNCGDATGTHFVGFCNGPADNSFEFACGADSACDEVMGAGSSCTSGLACENGGNPNCTASDHCDVNGHCCIDPNVIDLVTGACVGAAACNCGADGCCNGIGCIATGGDPDCDCVTDFGGTNCGIGGSCDVAAGSSQITNHNGLGVCCAGACAGGCIYSCSTGLCFLFLANASIIVGEDCCDGTQCYECDSGFVWNGVLNACMPLGGGIPDMGHSTDHGNYFKYDKDVDLVFTEGAEFLLRIAGGLALFVLILGGVYYIISGSNPDGQTRAKKVVTYAVIGLAIVLVSYVIVAVVESIAV